MTKFIQHEISNFVLRSITITSCFCSEEGFISKLLMPLKFIIWHQLQFHKKPVKKYINKASRLHKTSKESVIK